MTSHSRLRRASLVAVLIGLVACCMAPAAQADWRDSMREMAKQRARQTANEQLGIPTASLPGAQVYFIGLKNGDTFASGSTIRFGLKGMGVAPVTAGPLDGTGHFVLVVDGTVTDFTKPLPSNAMFRHFDNGYTEVDLALPTGRHVLQLMLADYRNLVHQPPLASPVITVTVH